MVFLLLNYSTLALREMVVKLLWLDLQLYTRLYYVDRRCSTNMFTLYFWLI